MQTSSRLQIDLWRFISEALLLRSRIPDKGKDKMVLKLEVSRKSSDSAGRYYLNMLLKEVQYTHSSFLHRWRDGIREKVALTSLLI